MLTALEVENFKGIGRPVRIDLRPITLLFGPNSAGKSCFLQAIHYAREILQHGNCDPDSTELGGPFVDLGGFEKLVHLREREQRDVLIRFWVSPQGQPLSDHAREPYRWMELRDYNTDLHKMVDSFCVTLRVGWSDRQQRPIVKEFGLVVNGEAVGSLQVADDHQRVDLRSINFNHPLLMYNWERVIGNPQAGEADEAVRDFYANLAELERMECSNLRASALPHWSEAIWLEFDGSAGIEPYRGGTLIYRMTAFFVGLGDMLRSELASLRYLGPIRETPGRAYAAPLTVSPSRWATGAAAWDWISRADEEGLGEVNRWMTALGTGCGIRIEEYKELPLDSPLMASIRARSADDDYDSLALEIAKLKTKERLTVEDLARQIALAPTDVGIGISQILPVIVAAIARDDRDDPWLVAIEQPELHVHPSIQVELGDLIAWRTSERRGVCIIETHSEHLMLRLLRRIEETHSGDLHPDKPRLTPDRVSVLFVEQVTGEVRATALPIDETGEFTVHWPRGFFEERAEELF